MQIFFQIFFGIGLDFWLDNLDEVKEKRTKKEKYFLRKVLTTVAKHGRLTMWGDPPTPQKKSLRQDVLGTDLALALPVPVRSVYVVNVLVGVVCDIVVDRLCDIVTGWDVVHGVVLGPVVRAIELLGRDGGEAGDFVLRVNH